MLNPKLTIQCYAMDGKPRGQINDFAIHFQDGHTRCHIWSAGPGVFDTVVHRNTPTGLVQSGRAETYHRATDLRAVKYTRIRERLHQLSPAIFKHAAGQQARRCTAQENGDAFLHRLWQERQLRQLAAILGYQITKSEEGQV